jgi:imidazolonepropionase-like amidohydrolase
MVIEGGRIVEMRPFCRDEDPAEDLWLDLSDSTVLPPLMDCHVHLGLTGKQPQGIPSRNPAYENLLPHLNRHVLDCLRTGVLCVRDGGDSGGYTRHYKATDLKKGAAPFQLKVAGTAWHREGRYGRFIGRAAPDKGDPVAAIADGTGTGVDHIKLIQSGLNSLTEYGRQTPPQFDEETIRRLYAFSRKTGVGLMVHANGEVPVATAISGGCDSIEHGYFMGEDNLRKLADARITWVPTVVPMKAHGDGLHRDSVEYGVAMRTLDHQLGQLSKAREYGVTVALGTDAGSPGVQHGKAVVEELTLLVAAGYTLEEAVSCATLAAARLLKTDLPGRLCPGTPATFIAKKGGPSDVLAPCGIALLVEAGGERKVPKVYEF